METREVPHLDGVGKRIMEKVVIQGLANPESKTCDVWYEIMMFYGMKHISNSMKTITMV